MTAEKRQTYTAEFTREAVRLVMAHGDGMTEAVRNMGSPAASVLYYRCLRRHAASAGGGDPASRGHSSAASAVSIW
jgi:transposase-like protein